jgi:pimeloyl-ACP methyl ester carboxylesterase
MQYFGDTNARFFNWSGGNSDEARSLAAQQLAKLINDYHQKCPDEPINVVAHSHGGNVALMASATVPIDELVTLGTPILSKYSRGVGLSDWNNVSSTGDRVQTLPWGAQRTNSSADNNITLSGFGHANLHTTAAWSAAFGP